MSPPPETGIDPSNRAQAKRIAELAQERDKAIGGKQETAMAGFRTLLVLDAALFAGLGQILPYALSSTFSRWALVTVVAAAGASVLALLGYLWGRHIAFSFDHAETASLVAIAESRGEERADPSRFHMFGFRLEDYGLWVGAVAWICGFVAFGVVLIYTVLQAA